MTVAASVRRVRVRRVHTAAPVSRGTFLCTSPDMKRRRPGVLVRCRRLPLKALRSNTVSVPAHRANNSPGHPPHGAGVRAPLPPVASAAAGLGDAALSDRAARIYAFMVLSFPTAEVDIPTLATLLPLTEQQIGNAIGEVVAHGLVDRRMRVTGYRADGARIRRYAYRIAREVA